MVRISRRDAVGAVHISQSRRDLTRRSLLGRREWQRGGARRHDGAAIVARPLSKRRTVEAGDGERRVQRRGQRIYRGRVRARQDDGAARRGHDVARATVGLAEWRVGGDASLAPSDGPEGVSRRSRCRTTSSSGRSRSRTTASRRIEIGDLAVPFNFAERTGARGDIYTRKLLRHALCRGPRLVDLLAAEQRRGPVSRHDARPGRRSSSIRTTRAAWAAAAPAPSRRTSTRRRPAPRSPLGGNWRLPVTNLMLAPKGQQRACHLHLPLPVGARLRRCPRRAATPRASSTRRSCPGMVVPTDLPALFSLRTKNAISCRSSRSTRRATKIETLAHDGGRYERRIACSFRASARTRCAVNYGDGQWTTLEFFVTEPLETVIQKRAAFLVSDAPAQGSERSGTSASTATGIRRTRSCAARKTATACRPG